MATSNPDGTLTSSLSNLQGILDKIIGAKTVGTDQRSLTTQQAQTGQQTGHQAEGTTGSVDTTSQQLQQLISQLTGTTNTTTHNTADVGALQQVFQQQQGGITPDALAAIFREGAKAAPQLVSSTANAVGARSGDNSPLATALTELNSNLVSQAATQSQAMRNASAGTAAQIAQATGGSTTTGSTTQGTTQNSTNTGTTSQQQNIQKLIDTLTNSQQNTNTGQQLRDDTTSTTGINTKQTGLAAGAAGLISLLSQSGIGSGAIDALTKFLTGGSGTPDLSGLFGSGGLDSSGTGITYPLPDGVGNYGGNPYQGGSGPSYGFDDPISNGITGFADGGVVAPKGLSINDKIGIQAPTLAQLMAAAGGTSGSGANLSSLLGAAGGGASAGGGSGDSGGTGGDGGIGGSATASTGPAAPSDAFSTPNGLSVTASQAISVAAALATMNPIAAIQAMIGITNNTPTATINAPPDTDLSIDQSMPESMATVSMDSEATDSASTAAANAAADGEGDSGAGSADGSTSGDGGDSGGDSGGDGGGWANGGVIPKKGSDKLGIEDGLTIKVSGGEAILPTDVVDHLGPDFIHSLINLFHTPAAQQSK